MVLAGGAVQPVKFFYRFNGIAEIHFYAFFLRLFDIALCAVSKCGKCFGSIPMQLDRVGIMSCVNRVSIQSVVLSAQFQVFPAGRFAVFQNTLQYFLKFLTVLCDRSALVREWQGDAAPAGEEAVDFHKWDKGSQSVVLYDGKVEGFILI